jgi:hypothetical protein
MFIEIFIIFQKKKQDYFFFIVLSLSVESILVSLLLIPDEKEAFIVFFLTWYPNLSQRKGEFSNKNVVFVSFPLENLRKTFLFILFHPFSWKKAEKGRDRLGYQFSNKKYGKGYQEGTQVF